MLDLQPTFRPVRRLAGYLPLEDLGLIGDGATAALVGLDGSVPWLCVPEFDAEPLFCGLLDHAKGGQFIVTPDGLLEARQQYEPDTGVLITELRTSTGLVRITDALVLRSGADLTARYHADADSEPVNLAFQHSQRTNLFAEDGDQREGGRESQQFPAGEIRLLSSGSKRYIQRLPAQSPPNNSLAASSSVIRTLNKPPRSAARNAAVL
jgi:hypothetical protein